MSDDVGLVPATVPKPLQLAQLFESEPATFQQMLKRREENRHAFLEWVGSTLKEKLHWYTSKGGRPCLLKGGAEEVAQKLGLPLYLDYDNETKIQTNNPEGWLFFGAYLPGIAVPLGRGASSLRKNDGDWNRCIKMGQKAAYLDAVIRLGGMSALYTQDLDDEVEVSSLAAKELPVKPLVPENPNQPRAEVLPKRSPGRPKKESQNTKEETKAEVETPSLPIRCASEPQWMLLASTLRERGMTTSAERHKWYNKQFGTDATQEQLKEQVTMLQMSSWIERAKKGE